MLHFRRIFSRASHPGFILIAMALQRPNKRMLFPEAVGGCLFLGFSGVKGTEYMRKAHSSTPLAGLAGAYLLRCPPGSGDQQPGPWALGPPGPVGTWLFSSG